VAPDIVPILAAIALLSAFIVAARAYWAWEAIGRASDEMLELGVKIEESRGSLRNSFAWFRGKLAETNAGVERSLWSLARFDESSARWEDELRARRAGIEDFRVRYVGRAGHGLRRARQTIRVVKSLIELRRTFLG